MLALSSRLLSLFLGAALAAFFALPAAFAYGQARQDWSAALVGIYFSGSERFSPEELERAAGLERAATVTPADFKAAADRLAASGAFREVGYAFEPSGTGVVVRYTLLDSEKWLPARFENLVWFTDEELTAYVKQRVPLFQGEVPPGMRMSEDVEMALAGLLLERGIPGRVQQYPVADTGGNLLAVAYSVSGASMPVEAVEFPGSSGEFTRMLAQEARAVRGREYSAGMLTAYARHNFLPVYLRRGYLKAEFGAPRARLLSRDGTASPVAVALPVTEGRPYRLRDVVLEGNTQFPTDELRRALDPKPGQPVDAVRFEERLGEMRKLYGARGYLQLQTEVETEFEDAAGDVLYRITVREGPQFRMGRVRVEGLQGSDAERLARSYGQKPGEPFNTGYEWKVTLDHLPAAYRANASRTSFVMRLEPRPETQTVDVVLGVELR